MPLFFYKILNIYYKKIPVPRSLDTGIKSVKETSITL